MNLLIEEQQEKRGKFKMRLDLLETMVQPMLKTHLMYKSNINWNIVDVILKDFLDKGLITTIRKRKGNRRLRDFYLVTEKGLRLVLDYKSIKNLFISKKIIGIILLFTIILIVGIMLQNCNLYVSIIIQILIFIIFSYNILLVLNGKYL